MKRRLRGERFIHACVPEQDSLVAIDADARVVDRVDHPRGDRSIDRSCASGGRVRRPSRRRRDDRRIIVIIISGIIVSVVREHDEVGFVCLALSGRRRRRPWGW